ncbi:3-oxoadipate enol-lactonase [Actinokineospora alba]|uniref:3-oxoadipate enol-lactonase n=1 Tax=Actinokineospora alba TaxID=504798 RepID=A0A1H0F4G8_9PSEU|nr:alpha/beta hydrolase [Actinokineospora alba]TDP69335.1 3-oxoadipate enol-lactonase [Actinokineospora alba]SDI19009.1 3-oxoadipate enol-lactonase/3-oxoadipate enol-lactonase / 4-carboxymuconolactone decarboxylase [Actinokineospora alba]SDN89495.1 3-oxoadipate enol-lactonase [Actinokineospora alba]
MIGNRVELAPGYRTCVRDEGAGDPVVLLPEVPLDLRSWDGVVPLLTRRGMRVIRCDPRGFGSASDATLEFSYPRLAKDVVALLDHLGIGRAQVVGHAFGGQVALTLARWFPQRVSAGSLVCTTVDPCMAAGRLERRLRSQGRPDVERLVHEWLGQSAARTSYEAWYLREQVLTADLRAWRQALSAMSRFDMHADLTSIHLPMRFVAAARDPDAPPSDVRKVAMLLPHGEFLLAAGEGHMLPVVAPSLTARLIVGAGASVATRAA